MKKEIPEYFIGLDAGTGSVGWAAADEQYGLVKCKGKDLRPIMQIVLTVRISGAIIAHTSVCVKQMIKKRL